MKKSSQFWCCEMWTPLSISETKSDREKTHDFWNKNVLNIYDREILSLFSFYKFVDYSVIRFFHRQKTVSVHVISQKLLIFYIYLVFLCTINIKYGSINCIFQSIGNIEFYGNLDTIMILECWNNYDKNQRSTADILSNTECQFTKISNSEFRNK